MSDPTDRAQASQTGDVSAQLTRSLTAIWHQNAGAKPSGTEMEVGPERIKFVLADAVAGPAEQEAAEGDEPLSTESSRYRLDAIAAVSRITGRKVLGFIPKRNAKTDEASDTYILEPGRVSR